ncbi:MAG: hypothetical protein FWG98_03385 [Candidatus Cloacimonetes bacterium]|nr:hypothetical protein [Candidatus Cloacimonadota bacterium]
MATWLQVKERLSQQWNIIEPAENIVRISFNTSGDRKQQIIIENVQDAFGNHWVQFYSYIGMLPENKINQVLAKINSTVVCGGLVKSKIHEYHYLRQTLNISEISIERVMGLILTIISFADDLEKQFIGSDIC